MTDSQRPQRQKGRPREAGATTRILRSALLLLSREGYEAMSMDQVALLAKVAKPTIYLRWPNKESLAMAAVATLRDTHTTTPTGDVWDDLCQELHSYDKAIRRPHGIGLIGTILSQEDRRPQMIEMFRELVSRPRRARLLAILKRGQENGVINPDADVDTAVLLCFGYYYAAHIGIGETDPRWPELVVASLRPALQATLEPATIGHGNQMEGTE